MLFSLRCHFLTSFIKFIRRQTRQIGKSMDRKSFKDDKNALSNLRLMIQVRDCQLTVTRDKACKCYQPLSVLSLYFAELNMSKRLSD